ncbi:translational GTPase TypA, partial [Candidatus Woesebacteria bacterium]|nr:translational GTPase TypA [Candidatus Woesebacteria bacterium]
VTSGDIIAIAGISELTIGDTVTDPASKVALPSITVEDPTIKITIGPNTSPFAGREGKYTTSRQIKERLLKEKETNLGLHIEESTASTDFIVSGRGELHLAVLIETMRREGYEMQISKPQVIYKEIEGIMSEPYEEVTIDVAQEYVGAVNEEMGRRKGIIQSMHNELGTTARLVFKISSANLLGVRNVLMTNTRGTAIMSTYFLGYEAKGSKLEALRNGALIATQSGTSATYGLVGAQNRGVLFIGAQVPVYMGMVVGAANKPMDIEVNVCKEKQLTNNRSSGEGVSESLTPATTLSLEQCLDFIAEDELLEVTPVNLRIRKKGLTEADRRVIKRIERGE